MTTYSYQRVSTDEQDANNQTAECNGWARSHNLDLPLVRHETASTKVNWRARAIAPLIREMVPGDILIVSEVSRLARSTLEVLEILQKTTKAGVAVHIVKSGLVFDGSTAAKVTLTILALAAELERDLIRSRTKAALAARRAAGVTLGRPVGTGGHSKIDGKSAEIDRLRAAGVSKSAIARILSVSRGTVDRYFANKIIAGAVA